ncbi:MAG: dual specificity protein phosphatase family protein [Terriglobales bacterium]
MPANIYWVDGPWPGKLGIAARPRGGDWLRDEIKGWIHAGVNTIVSLLTPDEERDLEIAAESTETKALGINFLSLPVPDRQVPLSRTEVTAMLERIDSDLVAGKNVLVHCRQGIGRSGMVAACLLLTKGIDAETAVRRVTESRGIAVPETAEQRRWIDQFASTFAGTD